MRHAHHGHLPAPLLFALHLAGQTRNIRLGTAIICLNLHHPLDIAEQVAVADLLTKGRLAVGFGSGSTPEEFGLFGLPETGDLMRHAQFEESLRLILSAWGADGIAIQSEAETGSSVRYFTVPQHQPLPIPAADLAPPVLGCGKQRRLGAHCRCAWFQHAVLSPSDSRAISPIHGHLPSRRGQRDAGGKPPNLCRF